MCRSTTPYYLFTTMADLTYNTLSTLLFPDAYISTSSLWSVMLISDVHLQKKSCMCQQEILPSLSCCTCFCARTTKLATHWCKRVLFYFAFVLALPSKGLHSRLNANMKLGCESKIPILWRNRLSKSKQASC